MISSDAPIGNSEELHVTEIHERDLVWSPDLLRWRRVTSVFRYTVESSGVDMIKLVFDLSTHVRHTLSEATKYHVLTDDEPHKSVAPEIASGRRKPTPRPDTTVESAPVAEAPTESSEAVETAQPTKIRPVAPAGDVRARREALKISRAKFAETCGLSAGALWRVEDGRPKDDELQRVELLLDQYEAAWKK